mmetsp:Transcript_4317/g.11843  ORF Transcript_4317/g.11843 Transcript_4317/m.11843 type:complete len:300 (+) Transcript_4317:427-1326(+)
MMMIVVTVFIGFLLPSFLPVLEHLRIDAIVLQTHHGGQQVAEFALHLFHLAHHHFAVAFNVPDKFGARLGREQRRVHALHGVEHRGQGEFAGSQKAKGLFGHGDFGLKPGMFHERFGHALANGTGQERQKVRQKGQARRSVDAPLNGLQHDLFHFDKFHFGVTTATEIGQQTGFHFERFVQFNRNVERRHGGQLVFLAIAQGGPTLRGAQVSIEVAHAHGDGFSSEFAKIHHLKAPLAHFDATIGVHGFAGPFPIRSAVGNVIANVIRRGFLDAENGEPIRHVAVIHLGKHGVFQHGRG